LIFRPGPAAAAGDDAAATALVVARLLHLGKTRCTMTSTATRTTATTAMLVVRSARRDITAFLRL
jgi:hypothetical protein